MKKNYLVIVGIGCLISVMPFIAQCLAMPPLLSGKNNLEMEMQMDGPHPSTQSWVASAIQLERMPTETTRREARLQGETEASYIFAYGRQGKKRAQGNGMRTNKTESIRLFPAAFKEHHQSRTHLPEPHTIKTVRQTVKARPKKDGNPSNTSRKTSSPKTFAVRAIEADGNFLESVQETDDSWSENPSGGVNFMTFVKGAKQKRDGYTFPPWYPVLTDNPNWKYIPDRVGNSKVCRGKSTLYNVPIVYNWLKVRIRNYSVIARPLFMPLREELFKAGESEMCHTKDKKKWGTYIDCAIVRNMRMEYMIPKYPLHQVAYYFDKYQHTTRDKWWWQVSTHGPGWGAWGK